MFEKALPFGPPRGERSFADRRTPAFVAVLAQSNRSRISNLQHIVARKTLGERQLTYTTSRRICPRVVAVRARAASKARMANLRRDSARRSYRSIASNFFASPDRMVASLSGPCGVANSRASIDMSGELGRRRARRSFTFIRMFA